MNCHKAEKLLYAERDQPIEPNQLARLERHLGSCDRCREIRTLLAQSAAAWKATRESVAAPDAGKEWLEVRRRIRAGEAVPGMDSWRRAGWLATGLAATAAVAFAVLPVLRGPAAAIDPVHLVARAESVEVGEIGATPMVFVDADTGWLVVWSVSTRPKSES